MIGWTDLETQYEPARLHAPAEYWDGERVQDEVTPITPDVIYGLDVRTAKYIHAFMWKAPLKKGETDSYNKKHADRIWRDNALSLVEHAGGWLMKRLRKRVVLDIYTALSQEGGRDYYYKRNEPITLRRVDEV